MRCRSLVRMVKSWIDLDISDEILTALINLVVSNNPCGIHILPGEIIGQGFSGELY